MEVDYEQIKQWAKSNEFFDYILELCRMSCACNAEYALIYSRIKLKEGLKYMCENDDEFKKHHEQEKKLKAAFFSKKTKSQASLIIHL